MKLTSLLYCFLFLNSKLCMYKIKLALSKLIRILVNTVALYDSYNNVHIQTSLMRDVIGISKQTQTK